MPVLEGVCQHTNYPTYRYCNIEYITASALRLFCLLGIPLVISYDIVCQWFTNRHSRWTADSFPSHLQLVIPEGELRYVIPKYHFHGHRSLGHNRFSLNLMPGVGRTDGEKIGRSWAQHSRTAASTREMGPGSQHDTLEDHFSWSNWMKYSTMGEPSHRLQT